ncbi:septum formation initiator family protein [Desulforamulus aeronauticus]|uniref:Cell division protein FtsL n=1 Tax=Desulforamulus aeronauticus DSM 10349 TaxID=1121421 RepID=A0A1M6QVP1_9FIRM|nr:cell division protein FtsL [Desulforamulus aeronauticus]SHK24329.1 cell division protein FtsL [Desulforamulus aeronauticus DSM 10349]
MSVAQEKFSYLPQQERQPEQPKVAQRLSKRAVRRGRMLLISCIFALFMIGIIVSYYFAQVSTVGYQISQLQNQLNVLQAEQEYLETQANQLLSLQRIEAIATTKLGMVKPDPNEVVLVDALPMASTGGTKDPASEKVSPGVQEDTLQKKDNQVGGNSQNPVIEAFVKLVDRWGKTVGKG